MKTLVSLVVVLACSAPAAAEDIFEAVAQGDAAKVRKLLDADRTLAAEERGGVHPTHSAARAAAPRSSNSCSTPRPTPNAKGEDDRTHSTSRPSPDKEVVALLLERAPTPTPRRSSIDSHPCTGRRARAPAVSDHALAKACRGRWRLERQGASPLDHPVALRSPEGQLDAARLLLAKGATVDPYTSVRVRRRSTRPWNAGTRSW